MDPSPELICSSSEVTRSEIRLLVDHGLPIVLHPNLQLVVASHELPILLPIDRAAGCQTPWVPNAPLNWAASRTSWDVDPLPERVADSTSQAATLPKTSCCTLDSRLAGHSRLRAYAGMSCDLELPWFNLWGWVHSTTSTLRKDIWEMLSRGLLLLKSILWFLCLILVAGQCVFKTRLRSLQLWLWSLSLKYWTDSKSGRDAKLLTFWMSWQTWTAL